MDIPNTPDPIEAPAAVPAVETPVNPETEKIKARFAAMSAESCVLRTAVGGALTDVAADWLIAKFVTTMQATLDDAANETERWTLLRQAVSDLGRLRRGDHSAGWLALQRARFDEEVRQAAEEERQKNLPPPGVVTQETIEKNERELNLL